LTGLGCGYFGLSSAVKHTFWRLVVHALCSCSCLSSTTTTNCLFSPFEPLDLRPLRILVAPTVLSLLVLLPLHLIRACRVSCICIFTPLLSALVFGSYCIVGGFSEGSKQGSGTRGQFTCEAFHFGLLDTRLLSHLSRDTAVTRTHCTRSVFAFTRDALFSFAAPVRSELSISTQLESRLSENYRE
jgi:hypothetical protein